MTYGDRISRDLTERRSREVPTILVALKSLLLPILAIYILGGNAGQPEVDFVFLYGLLPVATSSLAICQSYKIDAELLSSIASSLVLGKVFAFSLLLLGAYIITFSDSGFLLGTLSTVSSIMHICSLLGCGGMLLKTCAALRHPSTPCAPAHTRKLAATWPAATSTSATECASDTQ